MGWPETDLSPEFKPYRSRRQELSILDGCVLWGSRVVVPPQGRKAALDELHETHPGSSKMKALARSYIWWPKMDQEIEDLVKRCSICQETRSSPPSAPLHPWQWPNQPWSRLHIDFAGPYTLYGTHVYALSMLIPNGWMHTSCHQSHLQRPLRLSELRLHSMGCQERLSPIMVHLSQVKNSSNLYTEMG